MSIAIFLAGYAMGASVTLFLALCFMDGRKAKGNNQKGEFYHV